MRLAQLEELKSRIIDRYDVEVVVDLLRLDVLDILEAFEDILVERAGEFPESEDLDSEESYNGG